MKLNKQIHTYSLDTSCFYNEAEQAIHNRMLKLYLMRSNLKQKQNKITHQRYSHQLKRLNKIIDYYKNKLIQEFEVTRAYNKANGLIRELQPSAINDKRIVSIFESDLTRTLGCKINQVTTEFMIVQVYFFQVMEDIVKQGFMFNGEKYVLFSASAGQIRTKKMVVIREKIFLEKMNRLMCGLTIDKINAQGGIITNKFFAYLALVNSATEVWKDFDIDKTIVVDDFETEVNGTVDYFDDKTYELTRKRMNVPIPHTDGCGIMLNHTTRMARSPWIKGLMVHMDYLAFIEEHRDNPKLSTTVKDIYGKEWDILKDNIQYIFTKSQFKTWKYYSSWEDYKNNFKKYGCTMNYTNEEEEYIPNARINYQMLQTLSHMSYESMTNLAQATIDDIKSIGYDYRVTMRLLGATQYNHNPNAMQKSLMIYPELLTDHYNRQILKDTKKSLVKQAKAGKLSVNGKYVFVAPDTYAFCEWLFLGDKNPKGLLRPKHVSCNQFPNNIELDCLRSPHLYFEHNIMRNYITKKTKKYFDTKCIYTSVNSLISKSLQFDCDGDKLLVVCDKTLVKEVKLHNKNIVPLYYNMAKAEPKLITPNSLYEGLVLAYTKGKIGEYSNDISKAWNSGNLTPSKIKLIAKLTAESNFAIDSAKTLYEPDRPSSFSKEVSSMIKCKVPHFFIYAKDKKSSQVEPYIDTTVNMLDNIIPSTRISFSKSIGKFDYHNLMFNQDFVIEPKHKVIIDKYNYYNTHKKLLYNYSKEGNQYIPDLYVYQKIRELIFELPFAPNTIVDCLVKYLYTERPQSPKATLWNSFGEYMYYNLQCNIENYNKICPICGSRLVDNRYTYCNDKCRHIAELENKRK